MEKKDVQKYIKAIFKKEYQQIYEKELANSNKLCKIRDSTEKYETIDLLKRQDQVTITRLRLGHTRLTHSYLIEKTSSPQCDCSLPLTVKHIFECRNTQINRDRHRIKFCTLNTKDIDSLNNIIIFLKEVNLYDKI